MKLTVFQKRFLIVWILIHSFALFVNVADIEGRIRNEGFSPILNIFTTPLADTQNDFWPITTFVKNGKIILPGWNDPSYPLRQKFYVDYGKSAFNFYGIFNSYGLTEYIFYIILGIAFVLVPKMWSK